MEVQTDQDFVEKEDYEVRTPYYIENFTWIVNSVLLDEEFRQLLTEDGGFILQTCKEFGDLDSNAQKIYVRLFLRKHCFLPRTKIKYNEEFGGHDIVDGLLRTLLSAKFLENDVFRLNMVEQVKLLNSSQLSDICKKFRVGKPGNTKADLTRLLLSHYSTQRTPFGKSLLDIVRSNITEVLGNVCRYVNVCLEE